MGTLAIAIILITLIGILGRTQLPSTQEAPILDAPPPPGYPVNEIVMSTVDAASRSIIMRRGYWDANTDRGFGYDKIYHKHNIKNAVKYVVETPNGSEPEQNQSVHIYYAWAHRIRCRFLVCQVVDRRQVRVIVDFRYDKSAKGQKGVINGYYIQNEPRCPDWVDKSLNVQGDPSFVTSGKVKSVSLAV
ncbi:MAG: hypothetical protein N4J56_002192 [Chroococcidiopsis sp. SAG 2025]|uniref:hypothetical protein n=1 Tax=Chroococcidiopsis sp. SAG 2025 TaxID=171389 RepID=UPI002936DC50|nr:hypothetical protein [Chroococcidiopsis sp. SAG 2025]MDV2992538.1 hypothetical protein [Chroococcidiopsis sp. SAG 2025]